MLSSMQATELIVIIAEDFGCDLDREQFGACCFQLFEDIAGLECLDDEQAMLIINHLWSIYHDQR